MPRTKEFGAWFAHTLCYPSRQAPLVERGRSHETDFPWRRGRSLVVRLPLTPRAVVVGRWMHLSDEETAEAAMGLRDLSAVPTEEIRLW